MTVTEKWFSLLPPNPSQALTFLAGVLAGAELNQKVSMPPRLDTTRIQYVKYSL